VRFRSEKDHAPQCARLIPSTVVYSIPAKGIGTHYTLHECPACRTLVHRIVGLDVATRNGNSLMITEQVS
jgi:hypothetical protein